MGYALWTETETLETEADTDEFEDKQWNEPVIVRCNGFEYRAFVKVEMSRGKRWTEIKKQPSPMRDIGTDTEVVVTLPLEENPTQSDKSDEVVVDLIRYFKIYQIGKVRTQFELPKPTFGFEGE